MDIFGYSISRKEAPPTERSFVAPTDEGAIDLPVQGAGYFGTYLDLDQTARTDQELIKRYRDIALMGDVDSAIEDIVNEAVAALEKEESVELDLDKVEQSDNVKKAIDTEFKNILKLLRFDSRGHDYFRRWYIDGRIYFHKVIDTANPKGGISDLRLVDSRKIRKVREVIKDKDPRTGVELVKGVNEFYIYDERGQYLTRQPASPGQNFSAPPMKILPDAICYVSSGLMDQDRNMVLSYLHKAIKPANQLRMAENAMVIYRLARAPERRIFYIDVGNLPKQKAEQYLKDIMSRYRNKLVYDASTGEVRDDKKHMSMLEDFWLPRREGGQGTKIDTLPGGQNLGETRDLEYFQTLLYQALNVPVSRQQQQGGLNFGRAAEITRDELKFTKFVAKLRIRFSMIFLDLLKTQLILKGVLTEEDWTELEQDIKFKFAEDSYYTESKQQELLRARFELLAMASQFVGQFISREYAMKNILQLTDEEMEDMLAQIEKEPPPIPPGLDPAMLGMGGGPPMPGAVPPGQTAAGQPAKKTGPKEKGPRPAKS